MVIVFLVIVQFLVKILVIYAFIICIYYIYPPQVLSDLRWSSFMKLCIQTIRYLDSDLHETSLH